MSKITKMAADEIAGLAMDCQRLKTLKQELTAINTKLYSPRGATLDAVPTHGGGNKQEDKIVKMIDDPRRESLKRAIAEQETRIAAIEETIERLPELDREIIKAYFLGDDRTMARLMRKTNYSESHLIRKKLDALRKYAYMRGMDLQK